MDVQVTVIDEKPTDAEVKDPGVAANVMVELDTSVRLLGTLA